jgi:hypothetical protein
MASGKMVKTLKYGLHSGLFTRRAGISALLLTTLLLAIGFLTAPGRARLDEHPRALPAVILWAWERPEDLRFIDSKTQGIAYLAATITLRGDGISVHCRQQQLQVPEGTTLVAVVRLETDRIHPPALSDVQRNAVAGVVCHIGTVPIHAALQIDFDAQTSERPFYRALLHEVRGQLPERVALSITALASWCAGDSWIGGLPLDEAVPMLFRMGADRAVVLARLQAGTNFSLPVCRSSVGISVDEPRPWSGRRAAESALSIFSCDPAGEVRESLYLVPQLPG